LGAEVGRYLALEREEINQDTTKVHNEELHGLCSALYSRIEKTGDGRGKVTLMRKPEEKVHLGDLDVDGRMTLNGF
jgi:hypothetical protein